MKHEEMGKHNVSILGYLVFFIKEKQNTGVTCQVDGKHVYVCHTQHIYTKIFLL